MTRDEAVKVLKMVEAHGSLVKEAKEKAIEALEEQEPRWIPVGERLPENKQRVLVTRKSGAIGYITWNTWWNEQRSYPIDKVIAWMPLPEPYKEENKMTREERWKVRKYENRNRTS